MHSFTQHLISFFWNLGAGGLFLLGVLDSSFLFMPLGNDLLIIGLTSQHHNRLIYYAPIAAIGSTVGCLLLDLISRKGGEEGLKKMLPEKRIDYLKRKISEKAAMALALASLAPPPFPFTPVVGAAAAFGYPRWKLLSVILFSRTVRFTIMGLLAIRFGQQILSLTKSPKFEWVMGGFIAVCVIGSGASIYKWVKRSRRK